MNFLVGGRPQNRRRLPNRLRYLEDQKAQGESRALEKFQTRDWKAGDVYAPHDLSPVEMRKWGKRKSPSRDAFDALDLNPLDLYKVWIMTRPMRRHLASPLGDKPSEASRALTYPFHSVTELLHHVRIRDAAGAHQASTADRSSAGESAENLESDPKSSGPWSHAVCSPTPRSPCVGDEGEAGWVLMWMALVHTRSTCTV